MTETKLKLVAESILKDKIFDFENLISEQKKLDYATFLKSNKKTLEKIIDTDFYLERQEGLNEITLFLAIALKNKLIIAVDWSGEEYSGQVKRGITETLKQRSIQPIKWKNKNIEKEILASNPNRGEYLPLLFQKLDKELNDLGLSIGFFECGDDSFYFFVLPNTDFKQIENTKGNDFVILDTSIYDIYISEIGANASKVMMYLKNKFQIPLSEIKSFIQQDKILIATGNMAIMNVAKYEIENLGAKAEIQKR